MARGSRSGRAGSTHQEEHTNGADVNMDKTSPLKRKTPETTSGLDKSPAKRTRSQISKSSNPLSPPSGSESASGKKEDHPQEAISTSTRSTRGSLSGSGPAPRGEEEPINGMIRGRRPSGARTSGRNKSKPAISDPSKAEQQDEEDMGKVFRMDQVDEDDEMEDLGPGVLGRKKRREILGVLIAMETQYETGTHEVDPQPRAKTRLVKIVDVPFLLKPAAAEHEGHENGVKREDGEEGKGREMTLRKVLIGRDPEVTVEGLLAACSDLATAMLPTTTLPNPFAGMISTSTTSNSPIPAPTTVSSRLLGSKAKQEKELPIYEHLQAVKDVLLGLIPGESTSLPMPTPKHRWALHQRTTVPWPMAPRPTARGEKVPNVVPTDRVHLDWFTSVAATQNGKMEDVEQKLSGSVKLEDDEEEDAGGLTRLQVEGYLALATPAVVGPPDRQNEEAQRARGPRLGKTLYASACQKLRRYKELRKETLPAGRPVGFLSHYHSFVPSFAPTYDSTLVSGGWNYNDTVDAARAAAINREWIESGWNSNYASTSTIEADLSLENQEDEARDRALRTAKVLFDDDSAIDPQLLSAIEEKQSVSSAAKTKLRENAQLLRALAQRQEARLRRNERKVTDTEELALASRVSANLLNLASSIRPRDILPRRLHSHLPLAAELAQTVVSTPGAVYRGTLDPARPKAMAENYVVNTRDEPTIPKRREAAATPAATPHRTMTPTTMVNRGPPQAMNTPTRPAHSSLSTFGATSTNHFNGMTSQSR